MKINLTGPFLELIKKNSEEYEIAQKEGEIERAKTSTMKCISLYRKLSELVPSQRDIYLTRARSWEIKLHKLRDLELPQLSPKEEKIEEVAPIAKEPGDRIDEEWWRSLIREDTDLQLSTLIPLFHIAMEIAREGREGKKVGTAFIVGDAPTVLANSKQIIINPFKGYPPEDRMIFHPDLKETIKELAQLDGAFVITGEGIVEAAARQITVDTSNVNLPAGHGTRHSSIAAITQITKAIGIVVSQSGGRVSIIKDGKILKIIHP